MTGAIGTGGNTTLPDTSTTPAPQLPAQTWVTFKNI